jgi:hypothetical protein
VSASRAGGPDDGMPGGGRTKSDEGVEANARLTAMTAAVLLVLLAGEGITLLRLHSLLWLHVLIGTALVPPVLLKMGTTFYRFVRYYRGSPAYRRKGPPPAALRIFGPLVVVTTLTVLASGIALMFVDASLRQPMLLLHKASFILWFAAMTVHVLGHIVETARLAPLDWLNRSHADIAGARWRQWAVAASMALGAPLGLLLMGRASSWFLQPFFH